MESERLIAACGLDCSQCRIFQAAESPEAAQEVVDWFRTERDVELSVDDVRCQGCKADRDKHWSPECWILRCCVDDQGLEFCSECEAFPCQGLSEWAEGGERYKEALERLTTMKMEG